MTDEPLDIDRRVENAVLDGVDSIMTPAQRDQRAAVDALAPDGGKASRERLANVMFLSHHTSKPAAEVGQDYEFYRALYARARFDGQGMDDDGAFTAQVRTAAQKGRDVRHLLEGDDTPEGQDSSLLHAAVNAALDGKPWAESFSLWTEGAQSRPGWSTDALPRFEEAARRAHGAMAAKVEQAKPIVESIMAGLRSEKTDAGAYGGKASIDPVLSAPKELRPVIYSLLQREAAKDGQAKESGGQFWEAFGRGAAGLLTGSARTYQTSRLKSAQAWLDALKPGDEIGGRFGSVTDYALGKSTGAAETDALAFLAEPLLPNKVATEKDIADARAALAKEWDTLQVSADIEDLGKGILDPIKPATTMQRKVWYPFAEGALPYLAAGAFGGGSMALMYGSISDQRTREVQARNEGMSLEDASRVGGASAVIETGLEYAQARLGIRALTSTGKALRAARLSVMPLLLRNLAAQKIEQNVIEGLQDITPLVTQSLMKDVPEVNWDEAMNGPNGYWQQRVDTFFALLPVVVGGAVASTVRSKFSRGQLEQMAAGMDDVTLQAAGITETERAAILAEPDAVARLARFDTARRTADPAEAKKGATRLEERQALAAFMAEALKARAGVRSLERTADGWSLRLEDGRTVPVSSAEAADSLIQDLATAADVAEAEALVAIADSYSGDKQAFSGAVAVGSKEGITYTKGGEVVREVTNPETLATLHAEATMDGAEDINVIVNGSNRVFAERVADGASRIVRELEVNRGGQPAVVTLLHEQVEANLKAARMAGILSVSDMMKALNVAAVALPVIEGQSDQALRERIRRGAMGDGSEIEMQESLIELAVADTIGKRKDGGRLPAGAVSAALNSALNASVNPEERAALGKFRALLRAVRAYIRGVMGTVAGLKKARREGVLGDGNALDALIATISQGAVEAGQFDSDAGMSFSVSPVDVEHNAKLRAPRKGGLLEQIKDEYGKPATDNVLYRTGRMYRAIGMAGLAAFRKSGKLNPKESGVGYESVYASKGATAGRYDAAAFVEIDPALQGDWTDTGTAGYVRTPLDSITWDAPGVRVFERQADGSYQVVHDTIGDEATIDQITGRDVQEQHNRAVVDAAAGESFSLSRVLESWKAGGVDGWASEKDGIITLSKIVVPKDARGRGVGTRAMEQLLSYADATGQRVALTPSADFGGSKGRLREFYWRFGFKPYKGFEVRESYVREPVQSGESFSLSSVSALEAVAAKFESRIAQGGPEAKVNVLTDLHRTVAGMARAARQNEEVERVLAAGVIESKRRALRSELADQYAEDVWKNSGAILENEDLATMRAQPVLAKVLNPTKTIGGRLISRAKASRLGKLNEFKDGDFDGAQDLPGWLFRGEMLPDQLQAELGFDTIDEMWDAIREDIHTAAQNRTWLSKARQQLAEARARATQDAAEWASRERAKLAQSDQRDGRRALVALDAMILKLPADVRKAVGGFSPVADLKTNKQREAYFLKMVDRIDRALEVHLRKQFETKLVETLRRAEATKKAGKADKGKLGVNVHTWFDRAGAIFLMGPDSLAKHEAWIDSKLDGSAELTEAEIRDLNRQWDFGDGADGAMMAMDQERALADLFGGLRHREQNGNVMRGAADWEAAFKAADDMLLRGHRDWREWMEQRKEMRQVRKSWLKINLKADGTPAAVVARKKALDGFTGAAREFFQRGFSFEQLVGELTGRESETHRWAEGEARRAEVREKGNWMERQEQFQTFLQSLWPRSGTRARLKRLEALAGRKKVPGAPVDAPEMSELEAIHYTMLWSDLDSRDWLRQWNLGEDFQDAVEAWLSPEAREIRRWLAERYDAQYDEINSVYRRLHGVNMPRVANYAPRLVEHGTATATPDPLNPGQVEGRGVFAGFTKRRRPNIASMPIQTDALSAYWMNQRVVGHWRAWAETMREFRAVFSSPDTAPTIKAAAGEKSASFLNQWMQLLEQGGNRDAFAVGTLRRWMSANADNALVGKIGVLFKQLPAAYGSAAEIGWGEWLRSVARIATGTASTTLGKIYESEVMQQRRWGDLPETFQAASGRGAHPFARLLRRVGVEPFAIDQAQNWLRERIGWTDAFFTTLSAAAAYDAHFREAKALGQSDAQAANTATERTSITVARTAQPDSIVNKSLYENGLGLWGRMAFAFQSVNRQALFMTVAAFRAAGVKDARAWRMAITHWVITGLVTQTMGSLIRDLTTDNEPENEAIWTAGDYARAMLFGPLTGALFFGPMVDAIGGLAGGFERRQAVGPAGALGAGGRALLDALSEEDAAFDLKSADTIARAFGLLVGGRATAGNMLANIWKQVAGAFDNAVTTPEEEAGLAAKQYREKVKAARKAEFDALPDEQKALLKKQSEARKAAGIERDAARNSLF